MKASTFNLFFGKAYCPVCGTKDTIYKPLPDYYRENSIKYGYIHFGRGEMTAVDTYSCSACGASDRERLYAYWIDKQIRSDFFYKGAKLLHFAPEAALSAKIKKSGFFNYQTADYSMAGVDYKIDIMCLPMKNEQYDFFICSHVLEHVENDNKAIQELYRITRKGGCGILMAPVIVGLDKTIEDLSATKESDRWRLYGQNDHVRLYSHNDYVKKISDGGFHVEQLGKDSFGERVFSSLGLKHTSILYVVHK